MFCSDETERRELLYIKQYVYGVYPKEQVIENNFPDFPDFPDFSTAKRVFCSKALVYPKYNQFFFLRCTLSVEKDGPWEVHTLTLPGVKPEDAGVFEISASNRVGKTAAKANLVVITEPPMFPRPLEDVTTKLGKTEVFEVRFMQCGI